MYSKINMNELCLIWDLLLRNHDPSFHILSCNFLLPYYLVVILVSSLLRFHARGILREIQTPITWEPCSE